MKTKIFFCIVALIGVFIISRDAKAQSSCLIVCNGNNVGSTCCKADVYDESGTLKQGKCAESSDGFECAFSSADTVKTQDSTKICMYSTECNSSRSLKPCCTSSGSEGVCQEAGSYWFCSASTSSSGSDKKSSTSSSVEFTNPLKYKTVNEFATNVLGTLRSIIVVLSIIFIVLGGIFYITSAGDEKRMTAAKGAITASMIGLAVGIAAPSFLKEIYTIMGGDSSDIDKTSISESLTLTQISLNFLDFLLAIVGVLALIMLIVGGIMYLTSAGDDDRIKTAKKIVTYSIIGIAVSLASLVVVKQIAKLLT
jgi:hypothetical protein